MNHYIVPTCGTDPKPNTMAARAAAEPRTYKYYYYPLLARGIDSIHHHHHVDFLPFCSSGAIKKVLDFVTTAISGGAGRQLHRPRGGTRNRTTAAPSPEYCARTVFKQSTLSQRI